METSKKMGWGYGLGSMMRVGENLFGFYLIYYLSTVAGISPAVAGAIGGSALLVGAIASPVIGYFSDRSRSRFGRRRPFMISTVVPAMVLLTLLFTSVDLGEATGIYYLVIALLFALTYYAFLVPYDALGASLTTDYNQRTTIRSICTAILYVSVLVGGTMVVQVQAALNGLMSQTTAWSVAVILCCAVPGALFGVIAWRVTRSRETATVTHAASVESTPQSIRSALSVFTIQPVWAVLIWGLVYFFANAVLAGSLIYLGVFVLGLSEGVASTLFVVSTVTTLIAVIPGNMLAKKVGKRTAVFIGMGVFVAASLTMLVVGLEGYLAGAVITAAFGVCNSLVLSCSYAMIYDLREVTQLRLGEDKTAVILGWFSLVIGASGAFAAMTIGAVLQTVGFDPTAEPTPLVIDAIVALQTWVPAGIMLLSGAALLFWNINARSHAQMAQELQLRSDAVEPVTANPQPSDL
ncbi:MFS transporter [Arthrobacter sp. ISL-95]|uniref:MFS transporter n=1 Tax=Arthrobacter sp. ISL-95 TaxID=2819116 RepID=UPI001BE50844|nr:MFS transporter [Arthrobacter sp. ISL-95]MBT2586507.1 MFS transporter [Arthrobacter sp. ISL-95]